MSRVSSSWAGRVVGGMVVLTLWACGGTSQAVLDGELLHGTDETGSLSGALATGLPLGSSLRTLGSLNLRTGASTEHSILTVLPKDTLVTSVEQTVPVNGFYRVKFGGLSGYCHGKWLEVLAHASVQQDSSQRMAALERAKSGVGFSYWWGHGRWLPQGVSASTAGYCAGGACPSCSHSGGYGADCSGYLAKVWQVPGTNDDLSDDAHPYSTYNFFFEHILWSTVDRATVQPADALVYRADGAGHVLLFESGDGWGSMWTYEARNCDTGIVHNLRTVSDQFKAIARDGY